MWGSAAITEQQQAIDIRKEKNVARMHRLAMGACVLWACVSGMVAIQILQPKTGDAARPSSASQLEELRTQVAALAAENSEQQAQINTLAARVQALTARYRDNGDGTISDRLTGLMWEKKCNNTIDPQCPEEHDVDMTLTWNDATKRWLTRLNGEGGDTFRGYAGYSDWRLPTATELRRILIDPCSERPCIDAAFHNTTDSFTATAAHWSSSTIHIDPSLAWFVDFGSGAIRTNSVNEVLSVRAVRGGR